MADHEVYEIDLPPIVPESVSSEVHSISLPIPKDLAERLDIDERIHISATGVIKELSAGYSDSDMYSLRMDIRMVTIERENEFEVLSRDED